MAELLENTTHEPVDSLWSGPPKSIVTAAPPAAPVHADENDTDFVGLKAPFRWCMALALVTFPLIWVGGLVTTTDAGMAVPDWPGTYGYNLFLYPYSTWFFGPWDLFIEHGHRLLGSLAGLLAICLVVSTFRRTSNRTLRVMAAGALALVVFQGVLGGVRVLATDRIVAMIHGCVGPSFFAYTAGLAVILRKSQLAPNSEIQSSVGQDSVSSAQIAFLSAGVVLMALSFLQLVLGANLRHIEESASFHWFRGLILTHGIVAGLVLASAIGLAVLHWSTKARKVVAIRWSVALVILVSVQIGLGVMTWILKYHWPFASDGWPMFAALLLQEKSMWQTSIVTAHVATGSLLLMTATILVVQSVWTFQNSGVQLPSTSQFDRFSGKGVR